VLHPLIWLVVRLLYKILYKGIPIFSLLKRLLFKFYANGFPYIFFVQKLFISSFLQIGTHVLFSQNICETTSCKSNSWKNQFVQSSIKSTQVWNSKKNFSFQKNPLLANPIDSNQLNLKLWLEINCALEASCKYFSNHVWWCCVKLYFYVLFILLMVDCL